MLSYRTSKCLNIPFGLCLAAGFILIAAAGQGTDTSGRGTDTSGRGTDTSGRGTDTSGRGTDTSGRGTDTSTPQQQKQPPGDRRPRQTVDDFTRFQNRFKANVQRRISGGGFHREVTSQVDVYISSDDVSGNRIDVGQCQFMLLDQLKPGLYIDEDEVRRQQKPVLTPVVLSPERATWQVSGAVDMFTYLPPATHLTDTYLTTGDLSVPLHIRYHAPEPPRAPAKPITPTHPAPGYAAFNWSVPELYVTCTGGNAAESTAAVCGRGNQCKAAPCGMVNGAAEKTCQFVPIPYALFSKAIPAMTGRDVDREVFCTFTVPTGQQAHLRYVCLGTGLTVLTTVSMLIYTVNTLPSVPAGYSFKYD